MNSKFIWSLLIASWILRIVMVFIPQHGYIQPDEFFQFTEPFIGEILDIKWLKTWEFTTDQPVRCSFFPLLLNSPFLLLKEWFHPWISGYLILVLPRAITTLLSFIADYCLYRISEMTLGWRWTLPSLIYSTSYLSFCYMTHTFTNSLESILISMVYLIVVKCMVNRSTQYHYILAVLLALGLFNRPTFPAFAFVPVMFWLFASYQTRDEDFPLKQFVTGIKVLPSFLLTSMYMILVDTWYYHRESSEYFFELMSGERKLSTFLTETPFVVTPFNFINYNSNSSNLEKHGLHNPTQHMLVNLPLGFGIIAFMAYVEIIKISFAPLRYKMIPARKMVLLSFWTSLVALSFIPHQEPRFLLPCLLNLSYLYGDRFRVRKKLFFLWLVFNATLTYIYGFTHQAGVTKALLQLNQDISSFKSTRLDIIFTRTYLPPQTLLNVPQNDHRVHFHDCSVLDFPEPLLTNLEAMGKVGDSNQILFVIPSCLSSRLRTLSYNLGNATFTLKHQYFPHFTFEDFDSSLQVLLLTTNRDYWQLLRDAFSLNVYEIAFNNSN